MRFIFCASYEPGQHLDSDGLELLKRNSEDAPVMRAYISMAMNRVESSQDCRERCVRQAEYLVSRDTDRPVNWLVRAKAYWVRSCAPGSPASDTATALESAKKYESMLPTGNPNIVRIKAWEHMVENDLRSFRAERATPASQRPLR